MRDYPSLCFPVFDYLKAQWQEIKWKCVSLWDKCALKNMVPTVNQPQVGTFCNIFLFLLFLTFRIYIWPITSSDWPGPRGFFQVNAEQVGMWNVSLVQKYFSHQDSRRKIRHVVKSLDCRGVGRAIYPPGVHKDPVPENVLLGL